MLANKLNSRIDKGAGRIIWAFDPKYDENNPVSKFKQIFEEIHEYIAAIKFNRQLILPYGLKNKDLLKIISLINNADIPLIMDAKINDIGYTNESIARNYFEAGFDAVICNPFVGKDGLMPIVTTAKDFDKDVIFLVYMSHSSSDFGYGRKVYLTEQEEFFFGRKRAYTYELFANLVNEMDAAGCIVGATYPEKIKEVRNILHSNKLILSPGVGAQSGDAQKSRELGMDFAIIGRAITEGTNINEYCIQMTKKLQ